MCIVSISMYVVVKLTQQCTILLLVRRDPGYVALKARITPLSIAAAANAASKQMCVCSITADAIVFVKHHHYYMTTKTHSSSRLEANHS